MEVEERLRDNVRKDMEELFLGVMGKSCWVLVMLKICKRGMVEKGWQGNC